MNKKEIKAEIKRRRGRPTGFKLSEESKRATSKSKEGYVVSDEMKKKIGAGVKKEHETGVPIELIMRTDLSKCGTHTTKRGYVNITIPSPEGQRSYQMRHHTALMEKKLGRKLLSGEQIHHWGDKDNNNMMILTLCRDRKHHAKLDKAKKNVLNYIKK
jgi:hypothetical protein